MRGLGQRAAGAVALLALLLAGTLALWVGIPLAWLWIGSQVQGATDSVGAAIGAMMFGVVASIAALVPVLGLLTRAYQRARVARGLPDTGSFPLEVTLVVGAVVALAGFLVWFVLSGSSPIPVQIGY